MILKHSLFLYIPIPIDTQLSFALSICCHRFSGFRMFLHQSLTMCVQNFPEVNAGKPYSPIVQVGVWANKSLPVNWYDIGLFSELFL